MAENTEAVGISIDVTVKKDKFESSMSAIEASLGKVDDMMKKLEKMEISLKFDDSATKLLTNHLNGITNAVSAINNQQIKLNVDTGSLKSISYDFKAIGDASQAVGGVMTESINKAITQNVKDVKAGLNEIKKLEEQSAKEIAAVNKESKSSKGLDIAIAIADIKKYTSAAIAAKQKGFDEEFAAQKKHADDQLKVLEQTNAIKLLSHKQANAIELAEYKLGLIQRLATSKDAAEKEIAQIKANVANNTAAKKSGYAEDVDLYKKAMRLENEALKLGLSAKVEMYEKQRLDIKDRLQKQSQDLLQELEKQKRMLATVTSTTPNISAATRNSALSEVSKINNLIRDEQARMSSQLKADADQAHRDELSQLRQLGASKVDIVKETNRSMIQAMSESAKQNRVLSSTVGYQMTDRMSTSVQTSTKNPRADLEAVLASAKQIQYITASSLSEQLAEYNSYIRKRNAAMRKGNEELATYNQLEANRINGSLVSAIGNVTRQIDEEIKKLQQLQSVASNGVVLNSINKEIEALQRRKAVAETQRVTVSNTGLKADTDVQVQRLAGQTGNVNGLTDSINKLQMAMMALGVTLSVRSVMEYADHWLHFTNAVVIATEKTGGAVQMQERLFNLAQDSRAPLESITSIFMRMARAGEAMGVSQEKTVKAIEMVTKALAIMGTDPKMVRGGLLQLEQALGGVVVRGQEFKSILDSMPIITQSVAKNYMEADKAIRLKEAAMRGASKATLDAIKAEETHAWTISQLRNEMYAGNVMSKVWMEAMLLSANEINETFAKTHKTFAQAFQYMENSFTKWIGIMNQSSEGSDKFYQAMKLMGDNLNIVIGTVAALAAGLVSYGLIAGTVFLVAVNPITALIALVASLATGFTLLKDEIKVSDDGLATWGDVFDVAVERLTANINKVKDLFSGLKEFIDNITPDFRDRDMRGNPIDSAKPNGNSIVEEAQRRANERNFRKYQTSEDIALVNNLGLKTGLSMDSLKTKPAYNDSLLTRPSYNTQTINALTPSLNPANVGFDTSTPEGKEAADLYEQQLSANRDTLKMLRDGMAKEAKVISRRNELSKIEDELELKYIQAVDARLQDIVTSTKEGQRQKFKDVDELLKSYSDMGIDPYKEFRPELMGALKGEQAQKEAKSAKLELENLRKGKEGKISAVDDAIERMQEELRKQEKTLELKVKVSPQVQKFSPLFEKYGEQYGVSPALLASIAHQETGGTGDPRAYNKKSKAAGLMQFIPDTAKAYGISDAFDPEQSVRGAAKMMSDLLKMYHGDVAKALAGYNWGSGNVRAAGADWKQKAPDETKNYMTNVMGRIGGETQEKQSALVIEKEQVINNLIKTRADLVKAYDDGDIAKIKSLEVQTDRLTRQNREVEKQIANEQSLLEMRKKQATELLGKEERKFKAENETTSFFNSLKNNRDELTESADLINKMGLGAISQLDEKIKEQSDAWSQMRGILGGVTDDIIAVEALIKSGTLSTEEQKAEIEKLLGLKTEEVALQEAITNSQKLATGYNRQATEAQKQSNAEMMKLEDRLRSGKSSVSPFGNLFGGKSELDLKIEQTARAALATDKDGKVVDKDKYDKIAKAEKEIMSLDSSAQKLDNVMNLLSDAFSSFTNKIVKEGKSFGDALAEVSRDMFAQMSSQMMQQGMKDLKAGDTKGGLIQMGTSAAFMISSMLYSSKGKDNFTPATLANGTVLGSPNAVSQSVDNVVKALNDIHYKEYPELRSMGKNFKELANSIDDFVAAVAKSTGNFTNMVDIAVPDVNMLGDKIIGAVAGAVMGAVTGALTGGLFGAIGGGLLGGLMGFAGAKATVTRVAEGIMLNSATLVMDSIEEITVTGKTFAKDKIEKKGILGTKTSYVENYGSLSSEFSGAFNQVLKATAKTIWGLGKDLRLEEILGDRLTTIKTPAVKWDTLDSKKSGTTGDFLKDQINAYLDRIANTVFGNLLGRFQKLGEGMLETVGRLERGVAVAFGGLERLGIKVKDVFKDSPMGAIEFSNAMSELWDSTGNAKDGVKNLATALTAFYDITTSAGDKLGDSFTNINSVIAQFNARNPAASMGTIDAGNVKGDDLQKMLEIETKKLSQASIDLGSVTKLSKPVGELANPSSVSGTIADAISGSGATAAEWKKAIGSPKDVEKQKWSDVPANWQAWINKWADINHDNFAAVRDVLKTRDEVIASAKGELTGTGIETPKELAAAIKPLEQIVNDQADAQASILAITQSYQAILENRNTVLSAEMNILKTNSTLEEQRQYQIKKEMGVYDSTTKKFDFSAFNTTENIRTSTNFALTPQTVTQYDDFVKNIGNYEKFIGKDASKYIQDLPKIGTEVIQYQIKTTEEAKAKTSDIKEIEMFDAEIKSLTDRLKALGEGTVITTMAVKIMEYAMADAATEAQTIAKQKLTVESLIIDGELTTEAERRMMKHKADIANVGIKQTEDEIARKKELFETNEKASFLQDKEAAILKRNLALASDSQKAAIQYQQEVKAINDKWKAADPVKAKELIDLLVSGLNAAKLQEASNYLKTFGQTIKDWVNNLRATQLGSTKSQLDVSANLFNKKLSAAENPFLTVDEKRKELANITGAADTYIAAIKNYYGASKEGIDLIESVVQSVADIPEQLDVQEMMLDRLTSLLDVNKETNDILASVGVASGNSLYLPMKDVIDQLKLSYSDKTEGLTNEQFLLRQVKDEQLMTVLTGLTNVIKADSTVREATLRIAQQSLNTGTSIIGSTATDIEKYAQLGSLTTATKAMGNLVAMFEGLPTLDNQAALSAGVTSFVSLLTTMTSQINDKNFSALFPSAMTTLSKVLNNVSLTLPEAQRVIQGFEAVAKSWSEISFATAWKNRGTAYALGYFESILKIVNDWSLPSADISLKMEEISNTAIDTYGKISQVIKDSTFDESGLREAIYNSESGGILGVAMGRYFQIAMQVAGYEVDTASTKEMAIDNLTKVGAIGFISTAALALSNEEMTSAEKVKIVGYLYDGSYDYVAGISDTIAEASKNADITDVIKYLKGKFDAYFKGVSDLVTLPEVTDFKVGLNLLNTAINAVLSEAANQVTAANAQAAATLAAAQAESDKLAKVVTPPSVDYTYGNSYLEAEATNVGGYSGDLTDTAAMQAAVDAASAKQIRDDYYAKYKQLVDFKNSFTDIDALNAYYDMRPDMLPENLPRPFANGGAFTNGIVDKPTFFNMGLMGEAGSEAIMPLTNVNGKLGVYAANDSNANSEEELAELKAQNANLTKIVNLLVAQNQVHQAGYSAIIEENQQQTDSLRSIKQTNKEVAYG